VQYILTQAEYDELRTTKQQQFDISQKQLQKLCTQIANEMPIVWGWGGEDPKPWGCIIDESDEWYCDQCPVQSICPEHRKRWSK
jgi:hypothetical protein